MNGSIKIGTAFGIPIRLHWTFLVLLYSVALLGPWSPFVALAVVTTLFGCVLLHELGHSLVARRFGIRVIDITFWPLGGMARMSEMPEIPRVEGLVAVAGPVVNFVLAGLGFAVLLLAGLVGAGGLAEVAGGFILLNLLMGTFNLVPAFPLDGGRILRAWCGRSTDWVSATEQAVAVGRVFAGVMFFGSVLLMFTTPQTVCALPLIAIFVWIAGGRELMAVRMRHGYEPFTGLGIANRFQRAPYAEAHPRPGPSPAEDAGPLQAQRPAGWSVRPSSVGSGGFSEEAIRELEQFRGRLRRPLRDEE